jgi:hypothetical protein
MFTLKLLGWILSIGSVIILIVGLKSKKILIVSKRPYIADLLKSKMEYYFGIVYWSMVLGLGLWLIIK